MLLISLRWLHMLLPWTKYCVVIGYPSGREYAIFPARDYPLGPATEIVIFFLVINHLLAMLVRRKWQDIGLAFFFMFMDLNSIITYVIHCFPFKKISVGRIALADFPEGIVFHWVLSSNLFVFLFSSVAGRCCTEECTFIPESQARVCQAETECSLESTCKYPLIR